MYGLASMRCYWLEKMCSVRARVTIVTECNRHLRIHIIINLKCPQTRYQQCFTWQRMGELSWGAARRGGGGMLYLNSLNYI